MGPPASRPCDSSQIRSSYPVARAFLDARIQTLYDGTTEIMKEIIGRSLGL